MQGEVDFGTRREPIAINAEAMRYYIDVLQMLCTTDEAAVRGRREAWRSD